jgi:hypothetical protein
MKANGLIKGIATVGIALLVSSPVAVARNFDENPNQVFEWNQMFEWNQIFIETLIATNTSNSSQRLGAIVHTVIFDAYNGIEQRYTPIFVHNEATDRASRRATVVAAAYAALVGLFPSQKPALDASYEAPSRRSPTTATTRSRRAGETHARGASSGSSGGIAWGADVAKAVLVWRATDGFTRATFRSPVESQSVSGSRHRPYRTDECPGFGIHCDVRPGEQHSIPGPDHRER